jgi:hypothetical protein
VESAGCVLRCTDCGFIPRLQIYDYHFNKRVPDAGPDEGALVSEHVKPNASPLPVNREVNVLRSVQQEQPTASMQTRYEPIQGSKKQLNLPIWLLDAVVIGIVVMLLVAIAIGVHSDRPAAVSITSAHILIS